MHRREELTSVETRQNKDSNKRTVYKMIARPAMIWFGDFSTNKRVDAEMDFCWK